MKRFSGMLWPVLLLALLAVLAWLQFRWTGQISVAEQERMRASLQSSLRRFAADVDDEALSLFRAFRVERPEDLAGRLRGYRNDARYPDLVRVVYFAQADQTLFKVDDTAPSDELVAVDWPRALEPIQERLSNVGFRSSDRGRRSGPPVPFPFFSSRPPVVVVPVPARERRRSRFSLVGNVLLELDEATFTELVLPTLAERHFGEEYSVAVVDPGGELLYATADGADALEQSDARGELFSLASFAGRPRRRGERRRVPPEWIEARERLGAARMEVFVRHRAGSLEEFVSSARTRNLLVSFGILGILAASIGLVAVSTRRATALNDRKMEFVAGVSHELRTPVAVMRSAGQNLADGSVSDPERVKRYGTLIETEGKRLDDLVERVLELAGIQSNRRRYRRESVDVEALVSDVVSDCESARRERGVHIETRIVSSRAKLVGDPDAMRRAVGNLVMNAIKHGGDDNAIELLVERRGSNIAFVVSDRGPGIPEEDHAHLFEAFYRGRLAHERQVAGSGLGLSLVDHVAREHGGSVEVESSLGKGSRFLLYFPAED